eukprot:366101-Chlamydomonas_euryale.AAC.5
MVQRTATQPRRIGQPCNPAALPGRSGHPPFPPFSPRLSDQPARKRACAMVDPAHLCRSERGLITHTRDARPQADYELNPRRRRAGKESMPADAESGLVSDMRAIHRYGQQAMTCRTYLAALLLHGPPLPPRPAPPSWIT